MNDLELTRLCAEAMGHKTLVTAIVQIENSLGAFIIYAPLHDDAQAMALGKSDASLFADCVRDWQHTGGDLNRIICTAFANIQQARTGRRSDS